MVPLRSAVSVTFSPTQNVAGTSLAIIDGVGLSFTVTVIGSEVWEQFVVVLVITTE